ncbi:Methyltransferase type 12 [Methanobacterium lacus]|uniref:Methyltransferase type 12 n=1 Tax=Methanobacterium lacus (strain AL-21) TaxID=877455 RepID=F0T8T9_METLA|nr:class I SAM-dependent methyltransferase [Methanobacterium lacus]ADZ09767.1 Methyltransferase type 12 [Methanobacterium lacus]
MPAKDNSSSHRSEDYDLQIGDTIPYYESFHDETLNMVKTILKEPKIWLDTGCGTGTLVNKAVQEFDTTSFILSDPSPEMLNLAREKLSNQTKRLRILNPNETSNISLGNDLKPDVITAIQAHHYLSKEERTETTKVCYDLLRDDGVYITFENIRPKTEEGIRVVKEYVKNYQLKRGRDEETVNNFLKRFDVEFFPIKVEEHISLLEKTGFKVVELFWMSYMQAGFYCIK